MEDSKKHAFSVALLVFSVCIMASLPSTYIAARATRKIASLESRLGSMQTMLESMQASFIAGSKSQATDEASLEDEDYSYEDTTLFAGPLDRPVAEFFGDVIIRGRLTVSEDIFTEMGSLLTAQRRDQLYANDRCDDVPCVNGIQLAMTSCECVCDDHWSGQSCEIHDCYGNGNWNPSVNAMHGFCVCDEPYIADSMCQFLECNGMIATECGNLYEEGCSSPAAIGADCDDECLQPGPCSVRRNWGRPVDPSADSRFGLCGAAFSGDLSNPSIRISAMICKDEESIDDCIDRFHTEAPNCCSMSIEDGVSVLPDCAIMYQPSYLECALYDSEDLCINMGCAWCSDSVCMSLQTANIEIDCIAPPQQQYEIEGNWVYMPYECTDERCPISVIDRLADIWDNSGETNQLDFNIQAFNNIKAANWPELGPSPFLGGSGAIKIMFTQGETVGWLGARGSQLALYPTPRVWFIVYPPDETDMTSYQEEGTPMQLITLPEKTSKKSVRELTCIATTRMSPLVQLQVFGTVETPLSAALPISSRQCGAFRVEGSQLMDETGVYSMSINLEWVTGGAAAVVDFIPIS